MMNETISSHASLKIKMIKSSALKVSLFAFAALMCTAFANVKYSNATEVTEKEAAQDIRRQKLFEALRVARTENEGRRAEFQIWDFWLRDADITSRTLVMDAMDMRMDHIDHSLKLLDSAIKLKPDYAEAYNQRSFVYFLLNDFERALEDSNKALELEPNHFGALSGQAHIYLRQGRTVLMIKALQRAVKIHPWLKERHLIPTNEKEDDKPTDLEL